MRARKLAAVAEEMPPPDDPVETWAAGDEAVVDRVEDPGPIERLCIECGAEGCREHGALARLEAPSRAVHDALARVRRAAAEHRAAARALRVLVLSEVARGGGDLETRSPPPAEPCPRCAIRDAEAGLAQAAPEKAEKPAKRKAKGGNGQQALPFKLP